MTRPTGYDEVAGQYDRRYHTTDYSGIEETLRGRRHAPRTDRVRDLHRRVDAWQHEHFMTADSDIPTRQDNQQALDDLVALLDLETIWRGVSMPWGDESRMRRLPRT